MSRAQSIVCRGDRILMVKHRADGVEWWCLPGGGILEGGMEDGPVSSNNHNHHEINWEFNDYGPGYAGIQKPCSRRLLLGKLTVFSDR